MYKHPHMMSPVSSASQQEMVFEKLVKDIASGLLTKKQLAEKLAISEGFINKLMNEKGLPNIKLGRAVRFRLDEVALWLLKRRRP